MTEIVGASLTGVTLRVNEEVELNKPSLAVTVIVGVPIVLLALATGVKLSVQLGATPPMTIPEFVRTD